MIPISYDDQSKETQTDNGWVGLAIGGLVLLGGAGGVYAYALNQNKKRKLAARNAAASRRNGQPGVNPAAGAAAGAAATTSPYTRRAVAAPPVSGATQRQDGTPGTPGASTGAYPRQGQNPYARPATGTPANPYTQPTQENNPYARPTGGTEAPITRMPDPQPVPARARPPRAAPQAAQNRPPILTRSRPTPTRRVRLRTPTPPRRAALRPTRIRPTRRPGAPAAPAGIRTTMTIPTRKHESS